MRVEGLGPDVAIFDVTGRRVASPGHGLRAERNGFVWDLRDGGQRVRPGLYWAVSRVQGTAVRVTILE